MSIVLPALAVAFAAFCVWLSVRICNRRERWAKWTLGAALVGMLIFAAIYPLFHDRNAPQAAQTKMLIQVLNVALEDYALDHNGRYPTERQGLKVLSEKPRDDLAWKGPYARYSAPKDSWGSLIEYSEPSADDKPQRPMIWSNGPDKFPHTDDDIR
jgi:type II secretion system protein G